MAQERKETYRAALIAFLVLGSKEMKSWKMAARFVRSVVNIVFPTTELSGAHAGSALRLGFHPECEVHKGGRQVR